METTQLPDERRFRLGISLGDFRHLLQFHFDRRHGAAVVGEYGGYRDDGCDGYGGFEDRQEVWTKVVVVRNQESSREGSGGRLRCSCKFLFAAVRT